ncbi:MAG: LemA family protein [Bacteroidaceae bacterium]|nr:LemA family protein [Bacteroidaceae bacterium]
MIVEILITLGVLALVAAPIIMWFVKTQNELVNLDEKCKNALSQIEVQLNSRWDALLALANAAASYARHEAETLAATIAARRGVEIRTAADVDAQQDAFAEVMSRLMAVHESYPELQASGLYKQTMDSIKEYEENVRMARMIYNDTATRFNRYVRQWPSSMVAGQQHFVVRDYLTTDSKEKKTMPTLFQE